MRDMPRARKPYVQREITRHGKTVWYFRRGNGPRIRLPGDYESPEWLAAYDRALADKPRETAPTAPKSTLRWLVERYQDSAAFHALQPSTQRMRRNILKAVCRTGGELAIRDITPKAIAEGRDRRSTTPFAAINFMKTMGYLFAWAVDAGLAPANPVLGVARPRARVKGHKTWAIEDLDAFCARHPLGTKAHLAVSLLLFTGVRRGDVIRIGRQHIRAGVIEYTTGKTEADLFIPVHPPLAASIEAAPTGDMIFLTTEHGRPFRSAASFGNWFRDRCVEAGVDGRAHGLRKLAATIIADNEGSEKQLQAFFGWKTGSQSAIYTRNANARKLAQDAATKLMANTLSPHLASGAGLRAENPAKTITKK